MVKKMAAERELPFLLWENFEIWDWLKKSLFEIEKIHGKYDWKLDTMLQKEGNYYLNEKLGYMKTGIVGQINAKMDILRENNMI